MPALRLSHESLRPSRHHKMSKAPSNGAQDVGVPHAKSDSCDSLLWQRYCERKTVRTRLTLALVPNLAHEQAVLDAALPYVGPFIAGPRHLDEENDAEFPGHTFDFVGERAGGSGIVAIEVTEAIDGSFRGDADAVESWSSRMTADLRSLAVSPGTYVVSTSRTSPPMKSTRSKIIEAAQRLPVDGEVEVARDVWLHRLARDDDQIVFAWTPGLGGSIFDLFVRLFSDAITANARKLAHAAECGFETCLLMTPEWLPHGQSTMAGVYAAIREHHEIGPIPDAILVVDLYEATVDRLR